MQSTFQGHYYAISSSVHVSYIVMPSVLEQETIIEFLLTEWLNKLLILNLSYSHEKLAANLCGT